MAGRNFTAMAVLYLFGWKFRVFYWEINDMKSVAWLLSGLLSIASFAPTVAAPNFALAKPAGKSAAAVGKVAKAISVQISTVGSKNAGSGVILHKEGDVYTVLTAAHVLRGQSFRITTADGQVHKSIDNSLQRAKDNVDLATVQFWSSQNYQVAKLGNSQALSAGMDIYVAGYPLATTAINDGVWNFTKGEVTANASKSNKQGYSLIYSNATLPGMSGGPVLNDRGEVVAIHGQGDRAPNGQKTGFNLGIVIERCQPLTPQITNLKKLPAPNNNNPKADDYFLAANEKFDVGDYPGAAADYDRAIRLNPKYADAYNNRGNLRYLYLKNPKGAMSDYNKAIALRPSSTAYLNRGNLKVDQNDIRGAIADYDRAIVLDDSDYLAYNNRGYLKDAKLNDVPGAMTDYNRAISLAPRSVLAYNNRGNLQYHKLGNAEAAISDFNQAIVLEPKNAPAYYNRGDLYYFSGERPTAVQDFAMVAQLNPNGWLGLIAQGVVALEEEQGQVALTKFNQAAKMGADPIDYLKYRGLAYFKLGKRSAAIVDWKKAAQIANKLHYRKDSAILQSLMKSS
jgi:tetratricopeptide (TPR) repeat protein